MEWVFWIIYLSGMMPILGLIVMYPLGAVVYGIWLPIEGLIMLIDMDGGKGDFGGWFMGPFLNYYLLQPFLWVTAMTCAMVPGLNFVTSFLLGWAAVSAYFQWSYELFMGPVKPEPMEMPAESA